MPPVEICKGIHHVGVADRTSDLFEALWPLPGGVSYNSYIIADEKTVLVDTVKSGFLDAMEANVSEIVDPSEIDYVLVTHAEPDHSSSLPAILRTAPHAQVLGTQKAAELLKALYGITERVEVVRDGQRLGIGKRNLVFHETPFVHWPETMMVEIPDDEILFTGDVFGSFGMLDGGMFDDEIDVPANEFEILRYLSNVFGQYTTPTQKAIAKVKALGRRILAPTHGVIWRKSPERIVDLYDRWSHMLGERGVLIVYGSMYGNTRRMAEFLGRELRAIGLPVRLLDASRTHLSYMIAEAWRFQGVIVGAPTYGASVFPPVDEFLRSLIHKKLTGRIGAIFGSFGWGGRAAAQIKDHMDSLGWEIAEPVLEFRGKPTAQDLEQGRALAGEMSKRMK